MGILGLERLGNPIKPRLNTAELSGRVIKRIYPLADRLGLSEIVEDLTLPNFQSETHFYQSFDGKLVEVTRDGEPIV